MDQSNPGSTETSGESQLQTEDFDNNIKRVSCYLHCIDAGCGLNLIQERRLLDFKNAHRLPEELQHAIYQLAHCLYSPNDVKAFVFLEEDQHSLEKTAEFISVGRNDISSITGRPEFHKYEFYNYGLGARAERVIVYKYDFLREFYQQPLKFKSRQLRTQTPKHDELFNADKEQLIATFLNNGILDPSKLAHCTHCKGSEDGLCTCTGTEDCPRKPISRCKVHCPHCKGLDGPCPCTHGCDGKAGIECYVVHSNIMCKVCNIMEPIKGPRYNCSQCHNFNLCHQCYDMREHDLSHPFNCIERVGSDPAALWSRETLSKVRASDACGKKELL